MRTHFHGSLAAGMVAAAALALSGCAGTGATSGPGADLIRNGRYDEAITQLSAEAGQRPDDARVRRNLGIARLKNGDAKAAVADLARARELKGRDAPTLFFLGQACEAAGDLGGAVGAYEAYLALKPADAEVSTRRREVNLRRLQTEIREALLQESRLTVAGIPENTLAVMEFRNQSGAEALDPLGKGLAAMITGDLAKVRRFQVVEREKLPLLMREIKLGQSTVEVKPQGTSTPIATVRGVKERLALLRRAAADRVYYEGPLDETVGPAFEEAVKAFQQDAGLEADGRIGPKTRAALTAAYDAWLASARISVPAMDRTTAPRVGKLIGARLLVQGGITGSAEKELRIDAGMTESATGEARGAGAGAGGPQAELFRMEKEIVYELLNQLGVKLSGEEREAIGRLPTRNVNAFLAWSQGLDYEDRGQYDLARQACRRALELDPGFSLARQHLNAISGTAAGFSQVDAQATSQALAGVAEPPGGMRDRLDLIGAINGGGLAPGRSSDDQRDPIVPPAEVVVPGTGTVIVTGEVPRR